MRVMEGKVDMGIKMHAIYQGTTQPLFLGQDGKWRTGKGEIVEESDIRHDDGGGGIFMLGSLIFLGILFYFMFIK